MDPLNRLRLIDPQTIAKNRMSHDEAQAVIEMWIMRHRLNESPEGMPTLADLSEDLTIPPREVKTYLRQIRSHPTVLPRPARSLSTDAKLVVAAMAATVLIVATIASAFGRNNGSRAFGMSPPLESRITSTGMTVTTLRFPQTHWLTSRTINPDRFAFAIGTTVYEPSRVSPTKPELAALQATLREVVGGPLSDHSEVRPKPLTDAQVAAAIDSSPGGNGLESTPSPSSANVAPGLSPEDLVEWKQVHAAFAGKATSAYLPFAKVADKGLREAVQEEQDRLIEELARAALDLASGTKNK